MFEDFNDRWGGAPLPNELALITGAGLVLAALFGLVCFLAECRRHPVVLCSLVGAGMFWWQALTGHPERGLAALAVGLLPLVFKTNLEERAAERRSRRLFRSGHDGTE